MLSLRRLLLPVTVLAALALPAPALAACDHGSAAPASPEAKAATLCLLNAERSANGLRPLTTSPTLGTAAQRFAADMVARSFFDHVSPGGATLLDRIKAAGWAPSGSWSAGENIAWGSGSLATPEQIVAGWMKSPGHRANILNASFGQIGLGIAAGAPRPGVPGSAGTYVTDFASGRATAAAKPKRCARPSASKAARKAAARRCAAAARRAA